MSLSSSSTSKAVHRVFLLDDHPLFREGITSLINKDPGLEVCGEASRASEALERVPECKPDLIVLDLSLPGKSGLELVKDFTALYPEIPVIVLSMHDELLYAERVIRAGGRGYLMKDTVPRQLLAALHTVIKGEMALSEQVTSHILGSMSGRRGSTPRPALQKLTDREMEVFELLGHGKSAHEIGRQLNISPRTVDAHRSHIREKLGISDSNALMRHAVCWVETGSTNHEEAE